MEVVFDFVHFHLSTLADWRLTMGEWTVILCIFLKLFFTHHSSLVHPSWFTVALLLISNE